MDTLQGHLNCLGLPYSNKPSFQKCAAAGVLRQLCLGKHRKNTQTTSWMCQSDGEHLYPQEYNVKTMIQS